MLIKKYGFLTYKIQINFSCPKTYTINGLLGVLNYVNVIDIFLLLFYYLIIYQNLYILIYSVFQFIFIKGGYQC